jgi:hypothetical protein
MTRAAAPTNAALRVDSPRRRPNPRGEMQTSLAPLRLAIIHSR